MEQVKKIIFIILIIVSNLVTFIISNLIFLNGRPNYDENQDFQKPLFYNLYPEFSALIYLAAVSAVGAIFTLILFWIFDYKIKKIGLGSTFLIQFAIFFSVFALRRLLFYS